MKLNFWQRLGLLLLVVGIAVVVYERRETSPKPDATTVSPIQSTPTTLPATQPIP